MNDKIKINLNAIGGIQGVLRVDLPDSEKKTICEFLCALNDAGKIKGENTEKRYSDLVKYLGDKTYNRNCVIDAETGHMLWCHMKSMVNKVDNEDMEEFYVIMDKIAKELDDAVEKIVT